MRAVVFFFLIFVSCAFAKDSGFLPMLDKKFQEILPEYVRYFAHWFQSFNDTHLRNTEIGRLLNYNEMKRKLVETENHIAESRSMKKHGASMMPLVFHMGAASTWMLLTTLLAAKTLAVGLVLLVFKIAAGSAKLASFFTQLKHSKEDHHEWGWSPHNEHDYHLEHSPKQQGTITHHNPPWTPNDISHYFYDHKNQFHDSQNEFHDSQNSEFHHYKKHEYKTITPHDVRGGNDDFQGDYNHLEGAKRLDTKVE